MVPVDVGVGAAAGLGAAVEIPMCIDGFLDGQDSWMAGWLDAYGSTQIMTSFIHDSIKLTSLSRTLELTSALNNIQFRTHVIATTKLFKKSS